MSQLFFVFSLFSAQIDAGVDQTPTRIFITPFENGSGQRSQDFLSLLIAATLAERLEEAGVTVITPHHLIHDGMRSQLFLDRAQAAFVSRGRRRIDMDAALALGRSVGATHVLTGDFVGPVERWTVRARLVPVSEAAVTPVFEASASGNRSTRIKNVRGRLVPAEDVGVLHSLLAVAVSDALLSAGIPDADSRRAIARAGTKDHYAGVLLARAYSRYLLGEKNTAPWDALDEAKRVVLVDPSYPEARRFYGTLLSEIGQYRKARPHFEAVVAILPGDIRSLDALGYIEIMFGNDDLAAGYLRKALTFAPRSAHLHERLAFVLERLGDLDEALAEYERARDAKPNDYWRRQTLAEKYALRGRHLDCAKEFAAMFAIIQVPDAVFGQVACLRAGGRVREAKEVAVAAVQWRPEDGRFTALAGDLRLDLVAAVRQTVVLDGELEEARGTAQDAANDALIDLAIHGRDGCDAEREKDFPSGVHSAALAAKSLALHSEIYAMLAVMIETVETAFRRGEAIALAPDERAEFARVESVFERSARDRSELVSQFRDHLVPALRRHGCEAFTDTVTPADIKDVRIRLAGREVQRAVVTPKSSVPAIGRYPVRIVQFTVDNRGGLRERSVVLDGKDRGTIAPGASAAFTATFGWHVLCLVDLPEDCGQPGTTRKVILHDGFTIVVPPSR